MAQFQIRKATKTKTYLRMTIDGPSGSGKTYTGLRIAHALANGGKICVIDTERGSASKYAHESPDGQPWDFDVIELTSFSPAVYTDAINYIVSQGYDVLMIDSLSHAWAGKDGALQIKDRQGGNSFAAWRKVTPIHDGMVDAILNAPLHVITTMRSKMEHVMEKDEKGRTTIRKVGMAPVQRAGMEYEFDVVVDIDWSHIATVSKSRCSAMQDATTEKPGPEFFRPLMEWLEQGEERPTATSTVIKPAPAPAYEPTSEDLAVAMKAVGPSGDPLGKFDRAVWGKVASFKGDRYSSELKAYAAFLFETDPRVIAEWRNTHGEKLDVIAAQDSVIDDPLPSEA
jgi:hypothetical protein